MSKKCVVARNINGIALNNFEYLLDDDGEIKVFDDIGQALSFLKDAGATDEDMYYYRFFDYEELVDGKYMEACLLRTSDIFNRYKKYVAENISRVKDSGSVSISMEVEVEKNRPWSSSRHVRIDLECEEDESLNYELRLSNYQDSGWRFSALTIGSPLGLGEFNLPDQEIEIDLYAMKDEVETR